MVSDNLGEGVLHSARTAWIAQLGSSEKAFVFHAAVMRLSFPRASTIRHKHVFRMSQDLGRERR